MSTRYLCGMAMIAFLAVAAILTVFHIFSSNKVNVGNGKLNGNLTQIYEKEFDTNLAHRDASINLWHTAGFLLFGEGAKGVLIGQDGWLYTNEEFIYENDFELNLEQNRNYIRDVAQKLESQNIRLIILAIPSKARVYQDNLGKYEFPAPWQTQYKELIKFLGTHDIVYADVLSTFFKLHKNALFLKTDTHWTPLGARLAAMKVGSVVQQKFPYMTWEQVNYKSAKTGKVIHEGDLMRYTLNGKNAEIFGLEADRFDKWQTVPTEEVNNNLLGDVTLPVALVGTSFSANPLWNFQGFLKEFLGADVLNAADAGLGPYETMYNYLISKAFKSNKPKLIVWEIPERYVGISPSFMKGQQ